MLALLSIVCLIFGILQIILFFKIWAMTNDVRAIKEYLTAVFPKRTVEFSNVTVYCLDFVF